MIDFSTLLIPTTLRTRYILVALMLFILFAIITVFGWHSVQQGVQSHHHDMKVLADMEKVFHEFNTQYQNVKFTTLEFMVEPDKKHYQLYQAAITTFSQAFKKLKNYHPSGTETDFHEQINSLASTIQQCRQELDQVIKIRLDAEKTFPFSKIMLALNTDNIGILSMLNGVLLTSEANTDLPYKTKTLFSEIRYTWVRMMAEFRLLVSVRFGIFTGEWSVAYKNHVYNIELYNEKLNKLMLELKQKQTALPLQTETDVDHLFELIEDTIQYYRHVIIQLNSPEWRQDIVLLAEKIRPAFDQLDKSIHQLHIKVEQSRSDSMMQLTSIAQQLSDTLWFLFVVASLLVMLGYIIFSRTILRPISHVAQALKKEAGGEIAQLDNYSSAQEIQSLTDAFDEMRNQVKSRQQRLANILDNAAEAIITIDESGNIETFNSAAEKLFGYQSAEALGKNIKLLLPENKQAVYLRLFDEYLSSGREGYTSALDNAYDIEVLSHAALRIPVSIKISQSIIDGKTIYTALVVDISERLASEHERQQHIAEMAHAGRLSIMGEMAAGIAHELNQPLAAMSLYLQASLRRCDPEADTCKDIIKAVNSSIEQVERASEIIRKMRGFAHRETFHLENTDLNELIRKSVDLVLITQQDINPQPELVLDPLPLMASVDMLQIEQVMVNLIRNAFDAQQNITANRRMLQIRSERDHRGFARVFVSDAGGGVAKENVHKIFDTYFTTKADGLGMGLSICRSIIEEHDGVLWYRAREEGGSQFCFVLPLIPLDKT